METCSVHHDFIYKIRYKPPRPDGSITEWHVCERCFEKNEFGEETAIESITQLKSGKVSKVDVEKLSILTRKFTTKIKIMFSKR